jgi:alanine racemase
MPPMQPSAPVIVEIDLDRVVQNAEAIKRKTQTAVLAVVKADAYGLGASRVAAAVADVVDGFYVFHLDEAIGAGLDRWPGKKVISLTGDVAVEVFCEARVRPVVWTVEQASRLRAARPVVSVDTGQQRFAVAAETAEAVRTAAGADEAMTHAIRPEQVRQFLAVTGSWSGVTRHAAGSALLDEPDCRLDAVRPGLALYRGAVQVRTALVDARDSTGPAGYGGFRVPRFGIILVGYSHGLRPGPCRVNGQVRRVIEVGMQTSFVEIGPADRIGDRVEWLTGGEETDLPAVAGAWGVSQQEVLVRLTGSGIRQYVGFTDG